MQKKLIALALASAFAAPAFAATSNVDVYGILNMSVDYIDSNVNGADKSVNVTSNASRLGFKGTEDLGGGLAAIWQVESGFNGDGQSGSGSLASRNTFVGLKGGFGTLLVGQHDTPMKGLGRMVDNFGDGLADSRNILGSDYKSGANMWDLRTKNTIAYVTPDFSGLSATLAYVTDWNGAASNTLPCVAGLDCNKFQAWSGDVSYINGPLLLGAGYEKHDGLVATGDISSHIWRLVGGFSFAGAKLGAQYEEAKGDLAVNGDSAADRKAWGVFGNYAIGAVTLKANYLKADETNNVANSGAKQYTLGADYALSKRSTAYVYYAKVKNDSAAGYGLGFGGGDSNKFAGVAGVDPSVFGIGMKHAF
ncbi:MAG: porin [Hyphomicrobiaceae bacterium]